MRIPLGTAVNIHPRIRDMESIMPSMGIRMVGGWFAFGVDL